MNWKQKSLINYTFLHRPYQDNHFNDTHLLPYTQYTYLLETSNKGGNTKSPSTKVRTLAGIPTGMPSLLVSDVTNKMGVFEWGEPEVAHGPIETYVLQVKLFY